MKTIIALSVAVLCCYSLFAQKIWAVSSAAGFLADFTSLRIAINTASTGDIIMVHSTNF